MKSEDTGRGGVSQEGKQWLNTREDDYEGMLSLLDKEIQFLDSREQELERSLSKL